MIVCKRTDSDNPDFIQLVKKLDALLRHLDGEDHAFYAQFNKIDMLRNAVVVYEGETAIGCGAFKKYDDHTVEIKRMFVSDEHRQKGAATKILLELEAWAAEEGFTRAILETGIRQPEAISLYGKRGYVRMENFGQYAGVGNSVCFEKDLRTDMPNPGVL